MTLDKSASGATGSASSATLYDQGDLASNNGNAVTAPTAATAPANDAAPRGDAAPAEGRVKQVALEPANGAVPRGDVAPGSAPPDSEPATAQSVWFNPALIPTPALVPRMRHSWRRWTAAAVLVAACATTTVLVLQDIVFTAATTFSGVLRPAELVSLDFPTMGRVVFLGAAPGEHVRAGEVLARQTTGPASAALAAARSAVAADQAELAQLGAPVIPGPEVAQLDLQIQQANQGVAGAQAQLTTATASAQAILTQAQVSVSAAQAQLNQVRAAFGLACPHGLPSPVQAAQSTPLTSVAGGAPSAPGQGPGSTLQLFDACESLQSQMTADEGAVSAAQADVAVASAAGTSAVAQATQAVHSAQVGLAMAQGAPAVKAEPADAAQVALVRTQLAQAQAAVVQAIQVLAQTTIVAPTSGTVLYVAGEVGELVGENGTHLPSGPPQVASNSPSFSLFPPVGQTSQPSSNGSIPFIQMASDTRMVADAQIPEASIPALWRGRLATVDIPALGVHVPARSSQVIPDAVQGSGGVYYEVLFVLRRAVPGALSGMTVNVTLGPR
jgi:multidrug efflux pump subunit AcrA (membrane-fusion protein)